MSPQISTCCVCVCVRVREREVILDWLHFPQLCSQNMATKKIHPNCGPCALCAKTKFSYSHPCEWNQIQQNFITTKCTGITMTSCICKACLLDIKRNLHNPTYHPKREKVKPSCKVPGCKSGNVKACKVADTTAITQLLKLKQHESEEAITLCTNHYNVVYRSLPQKFPLFTHLKCKMYNHTIQQ